MDEESLSSEISSIRSEIQTLRTRKRYLASTLISSDRVQKRLHQQQQQPFARDRDTTPSASSIKRLAEAARKHAESNHHRVAFGVTAFPFRDPGGNHRGVSGREDGERGHDLLGIRIDVCTRNGQFAKPYYVLLRREVDNYNNNNNNNNTNTHLRVHKHTIPSFISIEKLEKSHLPQPSGKSRSRKQDLRAFVRALRRELVSWHLRVGAVDMLREGLGLSLFSSGDDSSRAEKQQQQQQQQQEQEGGNDENTTLGITSISLTSLEAKYVRMEWENGCVGRFKVTNSGIVERAVVIGVDNGRDKGLEDALVGGDGRVEGVVGRLRKGLY